MISVLFDKNLNALSRCIKINSGKSGDALWVFFSQHNDHRGLIEKFYSLPQIYAWTMQNDVYIENINQKIKDYKSGFGKLQLYHILKKRVFNKTTFINDERIYFDIAPISVEELFALAYLARKTPIGFFSCEEIKNYEYIYECIKKMLSANERLIDEPMINLLYASSMGGECIFILCSLSEIPQHIKSLFADYPPICIDDYLEHIAIKGQLTPIFLA